MTYVIVFPIVDHYISARICRSTTMSVWKTSSVGRCILIASLMFFVENGHCCGIPEAPEDGYFTPVKPRYDNGDTVKYTCNEGFSLKLNQTEQLTNLCMKHRWMNKNLPSCAKNPACGIPGTPNNGNSDLDEVRNLVRYNCKAGYILLGSSNRSCSRSENWTPQEMPKCVANLAYQKNISQIGVTGDVKRIVDGDFNYCGAAVTNRAFEVKINLGQSSNFTNILISFSNGSKIAVGLKSSNESMSPQHRRRLKDFSSSYVTTPLWFNASFPENARYIFIEPLNSQPNNLYICEIQMFNSLESTGCGTPDVPVNGEYINKSLPAISRYGYQCKNGYTLIGNSEIQCNNGQWTAAAPICRANKYPTTPSTPTTRPTFKPTTPNWPTPVTTPMTPTPIKPTSKDNDNDNVIGMMAIVIGATAASVVIVVAILIVVCIMKKYYKKKSHLPPCHAEHGPLCISPHSHYPMYKDYSQPRSQDGSQHSYGEPPIHLYDSIREHNLRFPLQRPSPDYDLTETVFNEGYGRRPPLPVPRPPLSSSGNAQQYEPLMHVRRNSNPYDEVNEDMVPGTSGRNEPDIMTSSRVDSLYIKGAPRTTL